MNGEKDMRSQIVITCSGWDGSEIISTLSRQLISSVGQG